MGLNKRKIQININLLIQHTLLVIYIVCRGIVSSYFVFVSLLFCLHDCVCIYFYILFSLLFQFSLKLRAVAEQCTS